LLFGDADVIESFREFNGVRSVRVHDADAHIGASSLVLSSCGLGRAKIVALSRPPPIFGGFKKGKFKGTA
jgi:hypothetical protein